jgi:hypothetical protein
MNPFQVAMMDRELHQLKSIAQKTEFLEVD